MAIQTTMGNRSDVHVTRNGLYWALGIIVVLFLAIGFSMSRNRVSTVNDRTSVQDTRGPASDSTNRNNGVNGSSDSGGYQRSSPASDANPARSE